MKKILFVSSEAFPLIKTGGLADFSGSVPRHLKQEGMEPVVLLPAYRQVKEKLPKARVLQELVVDNSPFETRLLQAILPGSRVPLWLVDTPQLYDRPGGPYEDESGQPWFDNDQRFGHFCKVAVMVATGMLDNQWRADVVHCNDWQTGLIPALLEPLENRPATLFTIHNLAYQGNFPAHSLQAVQLPQSWWSYDKLEFYGQLSYLKGGLVFADTITTVSPGYARQILRAEFGCSMEGLLQHRRDDLFGVLNGVDYKVWNPLKDAWISENYGLRSLDKKLKNKTALQKEQGLKSGKGFFTVGFIGRLVHQKGIELLIDMIERSRGRKIQWVVLGSGDAYYETALQKLAQAEPERIAVNLDYSEELAHKIEAGVDVLVMPSYYEPCGLNQMYSLCYGTLPVVSRTGGLADTVIDSTAENIEAKTASGFCFTPGDHADMWKTLQRAARLFRDKALWKSLQQNAMKQQYGWDVAAQRYIELYHRAEQRMQLQEQSGKESSAEKAVKPVLSAPQLESVK